MSTKLSWGHWPTKRQFRSAFNHDEVINRMNGYHINHGSQTDDYDPPAGVYDADGLWKELKRLWKLLTPMNENLRDEQERSARWISDILGTLGFEWI